jgi:hypothetical protein
MRSGVRIIQSFNPKFRNKPLPGTLPRLPARSSPYSVQAASGRERALQSGAARPPPLRLGLIREGAEGLEGSGACREA